MTTFSNPYIQILGVIDLTFDQLGVFGNRVEIRNELVTGIMSSLNSKLLDQPSILNKMKEIATQLSETDSFVIQIQKIKEGLSKTDLSEVKFNDILITEAKSVLIEFIDKTKVQNRDEVVRLINSSFS